MGCAAANATIDAIEEDGMLQNAKERGVQLIEVAYRLCHFSNLRVTQLAVACLHCNAHNTAPAPAREMQNNAIQFLAFFSLRTSGLHGVQTNSSCVCVRVACLALPLPVMTCYQIIGDAAPGAASLSGNGLVHSLLPCRVGTAGHEQAVPYY